MPDQSAFTEHFMAVVKAWRGVEGHKSLTRTMCVLIPLSPYRPC